MQLDYTLSFTDNQWICYADTTEITANSLDKLDENIATYLKSVYKKGEIEVNLFFDFDRFPQWHRQYMPHYFNRSLTFNLNS